MRKKIKNSLSIKVFLWVFSVLTICSVLIYGIVLTVLPKQYQITYDKKLNDNTEILVSKLEKLHYQDAAKEIYNFCIQNNVAITLSGKEEMLNFGEIITEDVTAATSSIATTVTFLGEEAERVLIVSSISQTADMIFGLMLRFLPPVLGIITLLSFFSAYICSKVIVTPIATLSQISKRMTSFDMTWNWEINSQDEIGVLASSLNTMASRLQKTMEALKNANQQLAADMDQCKALEIQRRNFFAAASHELKTPLTILKGQIENMMLGYGDYKNHEKYLPEALQAAENMEYLVKEITAISKMERIPLQESLQEVSLLTSTLDTIQALLPLAQDKHIQIHQKISRDIVLSVQPNLWRKALSNIIGNAIRHSPSGEEVFISLQPWEKGMALVIENTGVTIPQDDLSHIFTPFYRADKSRNKATGGSGLGLYIVKTILDLHNMDYLMKNTPKGVAFFLFFSEKSCTASFYQKPPSVYQKSDKIQTKNK